MRLILFLATFVIMFPVGVQARQISRSHSIEIHVECIEAASEVISAMNGYNLDSQVHFSDAGHGGYWGHRGWQPWGRRATFTRRVDAPMFRHVQEVLRDLGEVIYENEHSWYFGAEILDIETRIAVLSQEMERLSLMMAASDSLNVLIAVNDRLGVVSRNRAELTGRRNHIVAQTQQPIITITLVELPEDLPPRTPPTFRERVSRSFTNSLENTQIFFENLIVLAARISIPALIWANIIVVAVLIVKAKMKKRIAARKKREAENEIL